MTSASASRLFTLTLVAAVAAATQGTAHADDTGTRYGIGAAGVASQRPYAGDDNLRRVVPIPYVENQRVRLDGSGIALKLPSAGPFTFDVLGTYSFDGYKGGDAPVLHGMADRKNSIDIGADATWHDPFADVTLRWLDDVSGHSHGVQTTLTADHAFRFGNFEMRPRVSAHWEDAKYVNYYYGVRAQEATSTRGQYDAHGTLNLETGVRASWMFAPHQVGFVDAGTTRLGDEIADSPLVGRRTVSALSVGYVYRF